MRFNERINWEDWLIEIQDGRLEDAGSEAWETILIWILPSVPTVRCVCRIWQTHCFGEVRIVGIHQDGTVGDIRDPGGGF